MLKLDCRYFYGDKPCVYNKTKGIVCDGCYHYSPIKMKILIVKLDAIGDVLRTTSILKPLKKEYPDCYIEWCTRQNASDLFKNNSLVDEVITIEDDAFFRIKTEKYDQVINLDTSKISSSIAAIANAKTKIGFVLNERGFVESTSEAANVWLEMSAFDDFKKANTKSYQQIMYEIIGLDLPAEKPLIDIPEKIKNKIAKIDFVKKIIHEKLTIGLNVGVGTRWQSKGWPLKNWQELIEKLDNNKFNILLLGGLEEVESIKLLSAKFKKAINTDCNNSLLEFTAIVDLCDLVITADTLALHIATALDKKIVALFGPTSANEIELYGKGIKLTPSFECKCYYKKNCSEEISCMESISPESVLKEIEKILQ